MDRVFKLVTERPLSFFDLETTGVDPSESRIVELAIVTVAPFDYGTPTATVQRFNPGVPIPAEATAVHGITNAMVAGERPFREMAATIAAWIESHDLAGFNIRRYDLPLLCAEFKRAGVKFDPRSLPDGSPRRMIDLLQLFFLEEPRDLSAAVRKYVGDQHADAHSAEADTRVLPSVLAGMLATHPTLAPASLDELHARCDEHAPYRTEVERWFGDDHSQPVFQFGKHKGTQLSRVSSDYVSWMLKSDLDADVKEFVRGFLRRSA